MNAAAATPRIAPLEPPYEPETKSMLDRWMPPNSGMEPLLLFRTLGVHPELAARMRPLGAGILGHGVIEPILREVMILRTCALCRAEYEWGVHAVAFGRPLGLDDVQLAATVRGTAADPCWSEAERTVYRLADELHGSSDVSDELFAALRSRFTDAQVLELVVTSGWYHTISFVISTARVQLESSALRFADL